MTHKGVLICIEVGTGASQHLLLYCPIWGDRLRVTSASQHVGCPDSGIQEGFSCRFRNLGNFFQRNLESCALKSGIKFKESEIPLIITIRNPSTTGNLESKYHWESGIRQTVLNLIPYMERTLLWIKIQSSLLQPPCSSFTCQKICFS